MSSGISREDLTAAIWQAGVKDPRKVDALMRVIDTYAYHAARNLAAQEITWTRPEVTYDYFDRKRRYKCAGKGNCGQMKTLEEFPERKRRNPSLVSACTYCTDRTPLVTDGR